MEDEVCEHRGWEGPDDEWNQYPVSSTYSEPDETLLEPPVTQMMVVDGEEVAFVEGYRFETDWIHKYGSIYDLFDSVSWPDPVELGGRPCHFRILTDIPPWYVTLVGAPGVDPSNGWMVGERIIYECGRFGYRTCAHLNDDGFVEIYPIPESLMDSPYLMIQGHWFTHPKDRVEPAYGHLLAMYLFNFSED